MGIVGEFRQKALERFAFDLDCLVERTQSPNFHEKTKEQVARDKKRDRELVAGGFRVLRFSGSEIYNNPGHCIQELDELIVNEFSKYDSDQKELWEKTRK